MAWTFTDLRYGWKIAAGIVLAGTTVFVAENSRRRVNQADMIEIVLGVTERCMATQYGTNASGEPIYYCQPPVLRTWMISNAYVSALSTNAGKIVTNWTAVPYLERWTNVIGWRLSMDDENDDLAVMDSSLKQVVPYYVDPDVVVSGAASIPFLTVTGVWSKLLIGDGTNKFSRERGRLRVSDLEERYKVLEFLRTTKSSRYFPYSGEPTYDQRVTYVSRQGGYYWFESEQTNWAGAKAAVEANYNTGGWDSGTLTNIDTFLSGNPYLREGSYESPGTFGVWIFDLYFSWAYGMAITQLSVGPVCGEIPHAVEWWYLASTNPYTAIDWGVGNSPTIPIDHSDAYGFRQGGWQLMQQAGAVTDTVVRASCSYGLASIDDFPEWCEDPLIGGNPYWYLAEGPLYEGWSRAKGVQLADDHAFITWQFRYCTNRYW